MICDISDAFYVVYIIWSMNCPKLDQRKVYLKHEHDVIFV